MQYSEKVLPGQPILPIYEPTATTQSFKYLPGSNVRLETILFNNDRIPTLVSTTAGRVEIIDDKDNENTKIVKVFAYKDPQYKQGELHLDDIKCRSYKAVTPQVNDVVLARVTKITHLRVNVEILSVLPKGQEENVNNGKLQLLNLLPAESGEYFKALIRSQDVRSTERDSVKTWECYQPGDIIRAVVLSLGDGASFYLSTARNDLGVVFARNEDGELLYPLDWETMLAPGSGEIEKRKCAKPF
ncbi:hypothetical protein JL09_g1780 [Pichia kudriavzevii]|uniref:Exosome complex component CSL4 C-terminal domain-containing protein n=1 Tax=Pichia kudriavzevii TaxID=4909 RepID=A0A099P243_PICKU|nr:hypothetical protein JL09_g1780 [Pichia kudriavzevii]